MLKRLLIKLIRVYQAGISPYLGYGKCIFQPTCSEYAIQALQKYGVLRGGLKAAWRILRCNPFNKKGGYDPLD